MGDSLETFEQPPPKRLRSSGAPSRATKSKKSSSEEEGSSDADEPPRNKEEEEVALGAVLAGMRSGDFPIELSEQARKLRWNRRWRGVLGTYEGFVEMRDDALRLIRCPGGEGPIVLPRMCSPDLPDNGPLCCL